MLKSLSDGLRESRSSASVGALGLGLGDRRGEDRRRGMRRGCHRDWTKKVVTLRRAVRRVHVSRPRRGRIRGRHENARIWFEYTYDLRYAFPNRIHVGLSRDCNGRRERSFLPKDRFAVLMGANGTHVRKSVQPPDTVDRILKRQTHGCRDGRMGEQPLSVYGRDPRAGTHSDVSQKPSRPFHTRSQRDANVLPDDGEDLVGQRGKTVARHGVWFAITQMWKVGFLFRA